MIKLSDYSSIILDSFCIQNYSGIMCACLATGDVHCTKKETRMYVGVHSMGSSYQSVHVSKHASDVVVKRKWKTFFDEKLYRWYKQSGSVLSYQCVEDYTNERLSLMKSVNKLAFYNCTFNVKDNLCFKASSNSRSTLPLGKHC